MESSLSVAVISRNCTTVAFLHDLLTRNNIHEKVEVLEKIESRKFKGNVDDSFGFKKFFSYINIPDQFVAETKPLRTLYYFDEIFKDS